MNSYFITIFAKGPHPHIFFCFNFLLLIKSLRSKGSAMNSYFITILAKGPHPHIFLF
jgi:hypothetical protein